MSLIKEMSNENEITAKLRIGEFKKCPKCNKRETQYYPSIMDTRCYTCDIWIREDREHL